MHVWEQGIRSKHFAILLIYQLPGAAHFRLWCLTFPKTESIFLTTPLHLMILFWITVTVSHVSEMCLTFTATFALCVSVIQFQALLHPKAKCSSGVTFYFCYQLIWQLFFFFSYLEVFWFPMNMQYPPLSHRVVCILLVITHRNSASTIFSGVFQNWRICFRIFTKIQNHRLFSSASLSLTHVSSMI